MLTKRELEILTLFSKGLSYRDIAGCLFISEYTVGSHLSHVMRKLDVSTSRQAFVKAIEAGLIESPIEVIAPVPEQPNVDRVLELVHTNPMYWDPIQSQVIKDNLTAIFNAMEHAKSSYPDLRDILVPLQHHLFTLGDWALRNSWFDTLISTAPVWAWNNELELFGSLIEGKCSILIKMGRFREAEETMQLAEDHMKFDVPQNKKEMRLSSRYYRTKGSIAEVKGLPDAGNYYEKSTKFALKSGFESTAISSWEYWILWRFCHTQEAVEQLENELEQAIKLADDKGYLQRKSHLLLSGVEIFREEGERHPDNYDYCLTKRNNWLTRAKDLIWNATFEEPVATARLSLEMALIDDDFNNKKRLVRDARKRLRLLTQLVNIEDKANLSLEASKLPLALVFRN